MPSDLHARYQTDPLFKLIVDAFETMIDTRMQQLDAPLAREGLSLAYIHWAEKHQPRRLALCPYCNEIHESRIGCLEYIHWTSTQTPPPDPDLCVSCGGNHGVREPCPDNPFFDLGAETSGPMSQQQVDELETFFLRGRVSPQFRTREEWEEHL